jgi:sugar O-acyltransferase (sialic acid O-acetyltransferase NeuD family)
MVFLPNKKLIIIGAGGHGKVVADIARSQGIWNEIIFLDDQYPNRTDVLNWPIKGKVNDYPLYQNEYSNIVIAIGNNKIRQELQIKCETKGFNIPSLIHPRSNIASNVKIGFGCVIMAGVTVNIGVEIMRGTILNTNSTIDHDCCLGEFSHISPGANLAGNVQIGNMTWVGIGSNIIEGIRIGDNVIIGAGSTVVNDIEDSMVAYGTPCKIIKSNG